jgi:voltage-gated sodium channel
MRAKITTFVESKTFVSTIVVLIILNAITLGMETSQSVVQRYGDLLVFIDRAILGVFVLELLLKFYAYRLQFFKSGWNIFDLTIVSISLLPASGPFAIMRAFRIFRVLRLFSIVPQMRFVITGLLRAIPGMASVVGVIMVIFYISSVLVTKIFGHSGDATLENLFGDLGQSMFTLFQLMSSFLRGP